MDSNNSNNSSKKQLILDKLKLVEKNKDHSKYWNISWEQGEYLSKLVEDVNPKRILEVGTSNGFSTLWLALNCNSDSQSLVSVDVDEGRLNEAKKNFEDCEVNVEVHLGEIFELLENDEIKGEFDLIFLDAAQRRYRELIEKLEEKGLISKTKIVCDNVISHKMDEFIDFMKEKYHNCEVVELGGGLLTADSALPSL